MEFLVAFALHIPDGTPESEVTQRVAAEASASAALGREGRLVRLWRPPVVGEERRALGLYRAGSRAELDRLLGALPLSAWMQTTVTPLESHPNDPAPLPEGTGASRGTMPTVADAPRPGA